MHEVKIIGGQYRGRKIAVANAKVRPTTSIMRERLFNWLGDVRGKKVLDLFAGSGALGFEAISRGALEVTFVDLNKAVLKQLAKEAEQLPGTYYFHRGEIPRRMYCLPECRYDLVFIDPPFGFNLLLKTLDQVLPYLNKGGLVYTESEQTLEVCSESLKLIKSFKNSTYQANLWQL